MVGSKCCDIKNREVSNINTPHAIRLLQSSLINYIVHPSLFWSVTIACQNKCFDCSLFLYTINHSPHLSLIPALQDVNQHSASTSSLKGNICIFIVSFFFFFEYSIACVFIDLWTCVVVNSQILALITCVQLCMVSRTLLTSKTWFGPGRWSLCELTCNFNFLLKRVKACPHTKINLS